MKKPSRSVGIAVASAVVLAGIVGIALAAASRNSDPPSHGDIRRGTASAGLSSSHSGGSKNGGAAGAASSSAAPEPEQPPAATESPKGIAVQKPVRFGQVATFAERGVSVSVTAAESVAGKGRGIGEISGPSVLIELELRNDGRQTFNMRGSNVNAYFGDDTTPAGPLIGDKRYQPFTGKLRPNHSVRGTYVFNVPPSNQGDLRIEVAYAPLSSVAVLVGGV